MYDDDDVRQARGRAYLAWLRFDRMSTRLPGEPEPSTSTILAAWTNLSRARAELTRVERMRRRVPM